MDSKPRHLALIVLLAVLALGGLATVNACLTARAQRVEGFKEIGAPWFRTAWSLRESLRQELLSLGADRVHEDGENETSEIDDEYTATIELAAVDAMDRQIGRLDVVISPGIGSSVFNLSSLPIVTCEIRELAPGLTEARLRDLVDSAFGGAAEVQIR